MNKIWPIDFFIGPLMSVCLSVGLPYFPITAGSSMLLSEQLFLHVRIILHHLNSSFSLLVINKSQYELTDLKWRLDMTNQTSKTFFAWPHDPQVVGRDKWQVIPKNSSIAKNHGKFLCLIKILTINSWIIYLSSIQDLSYCRVKDPARFVTAPFRL